MKLVFIIVPIQNGPYPQLLTHQILLRPGNRKQLCHIHRLVEKMIQYVHLKLVCKTVWNQHISCEMKQCNKQRWIRNSNQGFSLCRSEDVVYLTELEKGVGAFYSSLSFPSNQHVNCEFNWYSKSKNEWRCQITKDTTMSDIKALPASIRNTPVTVAT